MAPRRDDPPDLAADQPSPSWTSTTPLLVPAKLDLREIETSMLRVPDLSDDSSAGSNLHSSLIENLTLSNKLLLERGDSLCSVVQGCDRPSPVTESCDRSLQTLFPMMLDETHPLEGSLETPWRALLAVQRAATYLDCIENAVSHPAREAVDERLRSVADTIADQLDMTSRHHKEEEPRFRISPWTMPSLAFDMTVGGPVFHQTNVALDQKRTQIGSLVTDEELPVKVELRAMGEVFADDVVNGRDETFSACELLIERCVHRATPNNSTVGEVLLKASLRPVTGNSGIQLRVKEARMTQVNALPPFCTSAIDLYTTVSKGDEKTGLTLLLPTNSTFNDETPELCVELVVVTA